MVNQFMLKANSPYWMAVKHIMRFWKGTLDFKFYLGGKNIALRGFSDVDWARDANDWQSTTRYMFLISVGVIL